MQKNFEKTGANGTFKGHVAIHNRFVTKTVNNPIWHDTEDKRFEVWDIVGMVGGDRVYEQKEEFESNVNAHLELAEAEVLKRLDLVANGKKQLSFRDKLTQLGYK